MCSLSITLNSYMLHRSRYIICPNKAKYGVCVVCEVSIASLLVKFTYDMTIATEEDMYSCPYCSVVVVVVDSPETITRARVTCRYYNLSLETMTSNYFYNNILK